MSSYNYHGRCAFCNFLRGLLSSNQIHAHNSSFCLAIILSIALAVITVIIPAFVISIPAVLVVIVPTIVFFYRYGND